MANEVIKRDGSRQAFSEEKMRASIQGAAQDAGIPDDRAKQIEESVGGSVMEAVNDRDEIATSEIAQIILEELEKIEPLCADAWRAHTASKE